VPKQGTPGQEACWAIQARLASNSSSDNHKQDHVHQRNSKTIQTSTKPNFKGISNFIGAILSAASLKTFVG